MNNHSCARHSAAVRAKEAQERKIDDGRFDEAFGPQRIPVNGGFPRPTAINEKGRVWNFGDDLHRC